MSKVFRKGKKFFIEVFYPQHDKKYMGKILTFKADGQEVDVFCTHFKKPNKHFFIKQQGYPLNDKLLKKLKIAGIKFVMIPEDGNVFKCYIARLNDYFSESRLVAEEKAEPQRVISNRELDTIDKVEKNVLKKALYF